MTDLAFAAQTYGLYSGLIYATPLAGAWLGDRVLGKTRTVTMGTRLMAAGHVAMASERFFLVALVLLILGAGCVIGNMAAQVGQLYAPDDHRRTRAFGLYLLALNIGALTAPLIVGTVGEKMGWHWGFGAAGFGMLIGLAVYLSGRRYLPPDVINRRGDHARLDRRDWRIIAALLVMLLPYVLAGAALNQAYGIMYVWADTAVDRHILGWEMPVTWVGIFDGAMTTVGVLVANAYWKRSAARGREMGDLAKIGVSCVGMALGYLYIGAVALLPAVPIALWLGFYVIIDLATVWQEAPPQAIISRSAPVGQRDDDGGFQTCQHLRLFPARLAWAVLRATRSCALLGRYRAAAAGRVGAGADVQRADRADIGQGSGHWLPPGTCRMKQASEPFIAPGEAPVLIATSGVIVWLSMLAWRALIAAGGRNAGVISTPTSGELS